MHIKLNAESVQQLEAIMQRKGYSSHVHTIQMMISQITKNFARHDAKKKAESNLHNI